MKNPIILKIILWTVVWLLALSLLAFFTLPLWIGPIGKYIINRKVSRMTKTEFRIDSFSFNQYTGRIAIEGVCLANPREYKEPNALSVKSIRAKVDMFTIFSDKIIVEDMVVEGIFVSEDMHKGVSNITCIRNNITSSVSDDAEAAKKDESDARSADQIRLEIRNLVLKDIKLKQKDFKRPISLASLTIANIGGQSDGIDFGSLFDIIFNALKDNSDVREEGAEEIARTVKDSAAEVGGKLQMEMKKINARFREAIKMSKRDVDDSEESDVSFDVFDRFF